MPGGGGSVSGTAAPPAQSQSSFFSFFPLYVLLQNLSSQTKDGSRAPCTGSTESSPLDRQGSPTICFCHKLRKSHWCCWSRQEPHFESIWCMVSLSQIYDEDPTVSPLVPGPTPSVEPRGPGCAPLFAMWFTKTVLASPTQ